MREIPLTQNQVALVDNCDFEKLNQFKWCAKKDYNTFYAVRQLTIGKKRQRTIYMHHVVLGKPPKMLMPDHRNGRGTDNRRKNLRFVTNRQNQQNQNNVKTSSQYPGISWDRSRKKWKAGIKINGKQKFLGRFINEKKAFEAYKQAVNEIGEKMIGEIL